MYALAHEKLEPRSLLLWAPAICGVALANYWLLASITSLVEMLLARS